MRHMTGDQLFEQESGRSPTDSLQGLKTAIEPAAEQVQQIVIGLPLAADSLDEKRAASLGNLLERMFEETALA